MHNSRDNKFPAVLGGILLALVLILLGSRGRVNNPALMERFAPRPTDPNAPTEQPFELPQLDFSTLPPELQRSVNAVRERFLGGDPVPALTPVASGPRAQVEVHDLTRKPEQVQVNGVVKNIADGPLTIPPGAFSFRDSAGISYATSGTGSVVLQPGQSTTFSLGVSLPDDRGLVLILTLPPDPPLTQVLLLGIKN